MAVSGHLEILTTLLAWSLYGGLWDILINTGVALVPFLSIMLTALYKARLERSRVDAGIPALRMAEMGSYMALLVLLLMAQPLVTISTNDVRYVTYACEGGENGGRTDEEHTINSNPDSPYQKSASATTLNNKPIKVPIWWAFTNDLFRGITAELIDKIPCTLTVTSSMGIADQLSVSEPGLIEEAANFGRECWIPALNKYHRENPNVKPLKQFGLLGPDYYLMMDLRWMGSRILSGLEGYYDSIQTRVPVAVIPYEAGRDAAIQDEAYALGGYPICNQWWESLLERLYQHADIDENLAYKKWTEEWYSKVGYSTKEVTVLYMLGGEEAGTVSNYALSTSFSNNDNGFLATGAQNAFANLGLNVLSGPYYVKMRIIRDAAPMIQAVVYMLFIIALPILLVFSEYKLSTVVTMTFFQFAIIFWSFLFALAYWMDNMLADSLLRDSLPVAGVQSVGVNTSKSILNYMSASFHVVLPALFTGIMGVAGLNVGNTIASTVGAASNSAGEGGKKGADVAQSVVTKVVS